jgi:hypothetical protein
MKESTTLDEQVEMMLPARTDIGYAFLRQLKEDAKQTYAQYFRTPTEVVTSPFIAATVVRRWSDKVPNDVSGNMARGAFYSVFMGQAGLAVSAVLLQSEYPVLAAMPLVTNILSIGYEATKMASEYVHNRIAMLQEQQRALHRDTIRTALTSNHYPPLDPVAEQALREFKASDS